MISAGAVPVTQQPAEQAGERYQMSTTLSQASHQWASRPDDERFVSLPEMLASQDAVRAASRARVVSSRALQVVSTADNRGLEIDGPNGQRYAPTNWAFGQLAGLAESPAGYLRSLPSPIVADALNFKLHYARGVEDVGVLLYDNGEPILRAAIGPNYGRIWNTDVIRALTSRFGDGVSGDWKIPGEFGKAVEVTKKNTTLYASDRDMFVFLADEKNRIEIPNRRDGKPGALARGFFLWNSEVGNTVLGLASFLFDYACANRIVWGAEGFQQINIRHTSGAPDRWLEEVEPVLLAYANGSAKPVEDAIAAAQAKKIDDVDAFLKERFGKRLIEAVKSVHVAEEGRPIETLWDATAAITAYARGVQHQDTRVELERKGGEILAMAA